MAEENKGFLDKITSDPAFGSFLGQIGASLLQPIQPGESALGNFGKGYAAASENLTNTRTAQATTSAKRKADTDAAAQKNAELGLQADQLNFDINKEATSQVNAIMAEELSLLSESQDVEGLNAFHLKFSGENYGKLVSARALQLGGGKGEESQTPPPAGGVPRTGNAEQDWEILRNANPSLKEGTPGYDRLLRVHQVEYPEFLPPELVPTPSAADGTSVTREPSLEEGGSIIGSASQTASDAVSSVVSGIGDQLSNLFNPQLPFVPPLAAPPQPQVAPQLPGAQPQIVGPGPNPLAEIMRLLQQGPQGQR